jgi:hypothetical protein
MPDDAEDRWRQIAADVEAAVTASEERLKALACRLPGGDAQNYIVVLCDFLASEYKWGLDHIAGLDNRQMVAFVEQALRRRAQTRQDTGTMTLTPAVAISTLEGGGGKRATRRKTGRPKKTERDSATKVIAALSKHHGYEEGGSAMNHDPATNRGLADDFDLSENALSRFLKGHGGYTKYKAACRNGTIDTLLALWNRECAARFAALLPEERDRGVNETDVH